jgi:spore germination protein KC
MGIKTNSAVRFGLLLLMSSLLLTGCWDRREINDVAFILTTALDLEPDGQVRVSMQIPLAGQLGGPSGGGGGSGGDKTYYIDSEKGRTIREAIAKVQARSARRLFSAHRRVVVISDELARRHGIKEAFEAIARFPENRITAYMIISKGRAVDLVNTEPKLERFSGEAIRELAKSEGRIIINIKNVAQALSNPNTDPLLLYMGVKQTEGSKDKASQPQVLGYAQFMHDKMVDTFEGPKSDAVNWLRREPKPYDYVIKYGKGPISLEVTEGRTIIDPHISRDGGLSFNIRVMGRVAVMENLSEADLTNASTFRDVGRTAAELLKENLKETIRQAQQRKTDPFNLGMQIWKNYPRIWKERYEKNWRDKLREANFDVDVQVDIAQIGYISKNIAEVTRQ